MVILQLECQNSACRTLARMADFVPAKRKEAGMTPKKFWLHVQGTTVTCPICKAGQMVWSLVSGPEEEKDLKGTFVNEFKVGADPEFVIVRNGRRCDLSLSSGIVGVDHGGAVCELRPKASRSSKKVVENLFDAIVKDPALQEYTRENDVWLAGGMYPKGVFDDRWRDSRIQAMGGHIHLSIKNSDGVVRELDRLTATLEALNILPFTECYNRRNETGYGKLSEIHTDKGRLEYRTMCSWLYSPEVSMVCLTGAKLVATDPKLARKLLSQMPHEVALKGLFKEFEKDDDDAKRVVPMFGRGWELLLVGKEASNMRETWKELRF